MQAQNQLHYLYNDMKITLVFLSFLLIFTSCDDANKAEVFEEVESVKAVESRTGFAPIEELFVDGSFKDSVEMKLLKELNICVMDSDSAIQKGVGVCSPKNFKFFPLNKNQSIENGFMLLVKAQSTGFPLRRLLIFQREKGELIKVNGFVANLIGTIKSDGEYDKLLLRFKDRDRGEDLFYNCLFEWENNMYQYKQVETIQGINWGGPVKAEAKDSISKEVYNSIIGNKMIF
ncbi:MAG: hypothetical protein ACI9G9_001270 [Psychromonas sp.]|jgi:hypothetical protein